VVTEDTNLQPRVLSGHTAHIEQIVFNHGGTFMASTSRDGTIRLWNWAKPQDPPIVLHDEGLDDWVWSATFTPDDEQLMMGVHSALGKSSKVGEEAKSNETIHVWPTKIEAMSSQLCTYIKRNMTKDEWDTYASGLKYERTCENYPANNK
ncbi:MAG TPA: hypothetical protein PKM91_06265, partial [Cyclobacteriaceae bacterium]|nr:hypothetical protein [Cyclobacteriaceae bacterium]